VLRSLTGFGCSSCSTSARLNGAECNHPTAFTGPPLLAGDDQFHCDWCSDRCWAETQPITLMPAHPHSVGAPHTHALLLPLFPSLLATVSETLPLTSFATIPVLSTPPSRSPIIFSRQGNTTSPSGFRNYHQTLFKGTDGGRVYASAAEFAWWSTDLSDHVIGSPRSTHSLRGFGGDRRREHLRPSH